MWTPLFLDAPEDEDYPAAVEPTTQILAEYLWLSGNGTQLRSQTRVITSAMGFVEGQVPADACPMTVVHDGVEVFLKPRKVFRDPFRGGEHILVMCDTFQKQGTDTDTPLGKSYPSPASLVATSNNHRVHCASLMEAAEAEQPLFSVEQEYELHQPEASPLSAHDHGSADFQAKFFDSPEHSSCTAGGHHFSQLGKGLYSPAGPQQHWGNRAQVMQHSPCEPGLARTSSRLDLSHQCASIFLSEVHQQYCLFAGIPVISRQRTGKHATWSYTIGPCDGVDLGDNLWASRYTLLRLAESKQQLVAFESLIESPSLSTDWGHTSLKPHQHSHFETRQRQLSRTIQAPSCVLHFSTVLSRHPSVGPLVLQRYKQKLQDTHEHSGPAYGSPPQISPPPALTSSYCMSAADSDPWVAQAGFPFFPSSSQLSSRSDSAVSLVPCSGQLVDHRPAGTMDPYLATMFLVSSTLDLAVPACPQQAPPFELACCDTASCQRQLTVCSHSIPNACLHSQTANPYLAQMCRFADAQWVSATLSLGADARPSLLNAGRGEVTPDSAEHSSAITGDPYHSTPQQAMECMYTAPYVSAQPEQQQQQHIGPYPVSVQFDPAAWDLNCLDAVDMERMETYSSGDITEEGDVSDGGITYQAGSGGEEEEGSEEGQGQSGDCNVIPSEELLIDALDEMDGLSFTAESSCGFLDVVRSDWAITRGGCVSFGGMRSRRGSCTGEVGM